MSKELLANADNHKFEKRFALIEHDYLNTGGHCMVSVFTVYDKEEQSLRYVTVNDEGFNLCSVDIIRNEPPEGLDYDDAILATYDWSSLSGEPSFDQPPFSMVEYYLYKYCQFEFYKHFCKTFSAIQIPVEWLPTELFISLSYDCRRWHSTFGEPVFTDGFTAWPSEEYSDYKGQLQRKKHERQLQDVYDFQQWFADIPYISQEERDSLTTVTMVVGNQTVQIPLHADTHELISKLLISAIEQW